MGATRTFLIALLVLMLIGKIVEFLLNGRSDVEISPAQRQIL